MWFVPAFLGDVCRLPVFGDRFGLFWQNGARLGWFGLGVCSRFLGGLLLFVCVFGVWVGLIGRMASGWADFWICCSSGIFPPSYPPPSPPVNFAVYICFLNFFYYFSISTLLFTLLLFDTF